MHLTRLIMSNHLGAPTGTIGRFVFRENLPCVLEFFARLLLWEKKSGAQFRILKVMRPKKEQNAIHLPFF